MTPPRRDLVLVPLDDLTREQAINLVRDLQGELRDMRLKSDMEVRRDNEKLRTRVYSQGYTIDQICETLIFNGFDTHDPPTAVMRMCKELRRLRAAADVAISRTGGEMGVSRQEPPAAP